MVKAFIFDVDGTLADTERNGHRIAFNHAFRQAGLNWCWDEKLYGELLTVAGGKERMLHFVNTHEMPERNRPDLHDLIGDLHKNKTEAYVKLLASNAIPLRSGVKRLLTEARNAGIRLAIATTTTRENVCALLESNLGSASLDWFEVIAAGDIVPQKKPAPDIYYYALDKMALDAGHCIAFEDSVNGLMSSTAAGLKTIITYNGYTRYDDFTGALVVLDRLGDSGKPSRVCRQRFQRDDLSLALIENLFR